MINYNCCKLIGHGKRSGQEEMNKEIKDFILRESLLDDLRSNQFGKEDEEIETFLPLSTLELIKKSSVGKKGRNAINKEPQLPGRLSPSFPLSKIVRKTGQNVKKYLN